ncbi:MAG: AlpA family phage regulatory protein [Comamonadaceae bacterium]|nr:AlpA family phage regulatory protein [Comamonadaceae bacterium]
MSVVIMQFAPAALDRDHAAAYCALSRSTFERLVREKIAPQARQVGGKRVVWLRAELDAWLLSRPPSEQLPPENTGAGRQRSLVA